MSLDAKDLAWPGAHCVHFAADAPDTEQLRELGLRTRTIDGRALDGKSALMAALAEALDFPEGFGANWDALNDYLRDLSWLGERGHVLIVGDAERLWREQPRLAGELVDSWLFAAARWARRDVPFHLVFRW